MFDWYARATVFWHSFFCADVFVRFAFSTTENFNVFIILPSLAYPGCPEFHGRCPTSPFFCVIFSYLSSPCGLYTFRVPLLKFSDRFEVTLVDAKFIFYLGVSMPLNFLAAQPNGFLHFKTSFNCKQFKVLYSTSWHVSIFLLTCIFIHVLFFWARDMLPVRTLEISEHPNSHRLLTGLGEKFVQKGPRLFVRFLCHQEYTHIFHIVICNNLNGWIKMLNVHPTRFAYTKQANLLNAKMQKGQDVANAGFEWFWISKPQASKHLPTNVLGSSFDVQALLLMVQDPAERLPMRKGGAMNVRKHPWPMPHFCRYEALTPERGLWGSTFSSGKSTTTATCHHHTNRRPGTQPCLFWSNWCH